ncbi:MAG: hypothetical protein AAFU67_02760 [Bacteroidota bacterium]
MKHFALLLLITIFSTTHVHAQKWKIIQRGIQVLEGLYAATQIYDWLTEDKEATAVAFRTNSSSPISIYINDAYVGKISAHKGLTCKVTSGYVSYRATAANGKVFGDEFYMKQGRQHDVFISTDYSNAKYVDNSAASTVTGDKVNVRSRPEIRPDNIIMKAHSGQSVQIIDRYIVAGEENDRITNKKCWFYPQDDFENKFLVVKGNAVKRIGNWDQNYDKVIVYSYNQPVIGLIRKTDLNPMKNKKWFKVKINGMEGWIYGDYVKG